MSDMSEETQPTKLFYSQTFVRKECGELSTTTWWRWKKDKVVPEPDIEIRGCFYYSAQRRDDVIQALIGSGRVA